MKHDIIDNSTGNIVGCISFESRDVWRFAEQIDHMMRLIEELQDRLHVLEQEVAELTEHHC